MQRTFKFYEKLNFPLVTVPTEFEYVQQRISYAEMMKYDSMGHAINSSTITPKRKRFTECRVEYDDKFILVFAYDMLIQKIPRNSSGELSYECEKVICKAALILREQLR